ncbi:hypothetical protein A2U01_0095692, partial [Trifolium medium]|nr:hypothetical protein [Trifolium medium]
MARRAVLLRKLGFGSVNCASRRSGWRVAPVSWSAGSGRLG